MLEHHADVLTRLVDVRFRVIDILVMYEHPACRNVLQSVDAAQEGALPEPEGPMTQTTSPS